MIWITAIVILAMTTVICLVAIFTLRTTQDVGDGSSAEVGEGSSAEVGEGSSTEVGHDIWKDIKPLLSESTKLVSVGGSCVTRRRIEELYKECEMDKGPSHFFDNTLEGFETVLEIIRTSNISPLFDDSNLKSTGEIHGQYTRINMVSNDWASVHDVPVEKTQAQMQEFKQKYLRRHQRLVEFIKNNEFEMYFIRFDPVSKTEAERFIGIIQNINPQCRFLLVSLSEEKVETLKGRHFMRMHLSDEFQLKPRADDEHWTRPYLNWTAIWHSVLKNGVKKIE